MDRRKFIKKIGLLSLIPFASKFFKETAEEPVEKGYLKWDGNNLEIVSGESIVSKSSSFGNTLSYSDIKNAYKKDIDLRK